MSPADIESRVTAVIADIMNAAPATIRRTTRLEHDLGADEIDTIEILVALEVEFDIEFPEDSSEHVATVGYLADLVAESVRI